MYRTSEYASEGTLEHSARSIAGHGPSYEWPKVPPPPVESSWPAQPSPEVFALPDRSEAASERDVVADSGRTHLRIAFLISRADDIGGAQIHVRDLSTALRARGHDVLVLAGGEGVLADHLRERGVPFHHLQCLHRSVGPRQAVRAVLEIRRLLRELCPDLVSTHSTTAGLLGRVAARTLGIPVLFTAHGWGFSEGRPWRQRIPFWLVEWAAAPLAARIITVCEADLRVAIRSRLTRRARLVAIPNAMPDVEESLRAMPGRVPPGLVMVARLSWWKDHATLLRALAQLSDLDWELELVGDGPLRGEIEALADSLGIAPRVRFAGFCSDVPARLANAQVFVLATKWEGFPRSILEAMRAGLPVVSSNVGGVCESVRDGATGFVVPSGDVASLRDRLGMLLASPEQRIRMGRAGRARYEERFLLERLVAETTAVYTSVLAVPGETQGHAGNGLTAAHRCPICGNAEGRFLRRGYYRKCPLCRGASRLEPAPAERLDQYWRGAEFWSDEEIAKRKHREPVFHEAFQILRRHKPEPGSVLDIGCGIGTFLALCRAEGWRVTGVDPSPIACQIAKQEYGLDLVNDLFSSERFDEQKFDAVFAAQVLHHLPDPESFLADIARVVAADGVILLRTPNLVPQEAVLRLQRLLGRKEQFFCGPSLHVFHPETLRLLFAQQGFEEVLFLNSRPFIEPIHGRELVPNARRLLYGGLKLATRAGTEGLRRASGDRALLGPSILVVARRRAKPTSAQLD